MQYGGWGKRGQFIEGKVSSRRSALQARFKSNKFEAPREYEVEELQEDWGNLASEPMRSSPFPL